MQLSFNPLSLVCLYDYDDSDPISRLDEDTLWCACSMCSHESMCLWLYEYTNRLCQNEWCSLVYRTQCAELWPLSLLLQQAGELVALPHEVTVVPLLVLQPMKRMSVSSLHQQQLLQHPSVGFPLLLHKPVQLTHKNTLRTRWEHARNMLGKRSEHARNTLRRRLEHARNTLRWRSEHA